MIGNPELFMIGFDYLSASTQEEIQRNLSLLYETPEGSCPGDRLFGLNTDFQDAPMNVATNLFALEVIEKTELYESRVEILNIEYTQSEDGDLIPKIMIGIRGNTD